ncbi:MAG TPA: winged helix-turn-helix domain-containing protein [Terriglobales bacterium]
MVQPLYEFGQFRLDAKGRILFRGDAPVPLPPKAVDTLILLATNPGAVLDKAEILKQVWQDAFVEEGSLTRTISLLRKALGGREQEYIATISKRGYRFVAHVRQISYPPRTTPEQLVIVVLPFESLGGSEGQDYFNDGLTEEMITQLSRLNPERLRVIARTSAMTYKGTKKNVKEIGRQLNVSHVLEGSVRRETGRVRIAAQLIQVSDETHVWAQTYDRNLGDILKLQSEVAQAVAREIRVKLTPQEKRRMAAVGEVSPAAYEALLKGRHLWNKRTEEGMRKSISFYEEAIRQNPDYAMAYAGIADSHVMLACRGMVPAKETFRKAKSAARKALDLDSELAEAHGSLAHVRLHDWDWEGLERDFQRAIELNPAEGIVYYWYGEFLMSQGREDDAIAVTRKAYESDPLSAVIGASLAMILYLARRFDEAASVLDRVQEISPEHFLPHMRMGLVRIQQREYLGAVEELEKAVQLADKSTETLAALAMAYAAAGLRAKAQDITNDLEAHRKERFVLPYNFAKIYAVFNDVEKAFAWLETAYDDGSPDLIELNSEPIFDTLRVDLRFSNLMGRVGWKLEGA